MVIITDKRFERVQDKIEKFADIDKPGYSVDNSIANNHDHIIDDRELFHQMAFDTFEGKKNIGIIDNKLSYVENLISM